MSRLLVTASLLIQVIAACAPANENAVHVDPIKNVVELSAGVTMRRLRGDTWIHITRKGELTANGLLLIRETSSMLIDTGWNAAQTKAILAWARDEQFRPVREAIVTHSHDDRMGGIRALMEEGIEVTAVSATAEQARRRMLPEPTDLFEGFRRMGPVELFYPGAGHTPDNIVVYIKEQGILFAGCLIRSGGAEELGNLEDAYVEAWYHAIPKVKQRYPNPKIIVPGHGKPGGPELYRHTVDLVIAASAKGAD